MIADEFKEPQKPLILIVDDVPKNLQVLGNILRDRGYKISMAANGKQALDIVDRRIPDLVLLDVMMPEMDGFQVCEKLKSSERTKNIPVIFLTARTGVEDIVKAFEIGAVDYITKPFNKAELLARVNTHLQLKKAQNDIIELEHKNTVFAMAVTANHEINQPLTVLQGNFEILKNGIDRESLPERQQKCLIKMENSLEKIQGILHKFMDFSSLHFEDYMGERKMVILQDKDEEQG